MGKKKEKKKKLEEEQAIKEMNLNLDADVSLDKEEDLIEKDIANWMKKKAEKEQKRLEELKAKITIAGVKNTGTITDEEKIFNRIELKTNFDFSKIVQILVSEVEESPKKNYFYVNVILLTKSPVSILVPYLYEKNEKNDLKHWTFVNNSLKQSTFSIDQFQNI
eukprot:gene8772-720_t